MQLCSEQSDVVTSNDMERGTYKLLLPAVLIVCAISQPALLFAEQAKSGHAVPTIRKLQLYSPNASIDMFLCLDAPQGANSFAALQNAVKQNPHSAMAYVYRGSAYWRDGDEEKALVDYKQALALDPTCARAHIGLGRIYESQSKWAEAFNEFQKAAQMGTPDQAIKALWESAFLHRELKQYDVALTQYDVVLKYKGLDKKREAYAIMQRGEVYFRTGKVALALRDFNEAIVVDPSLSTAYMLRAHLFQQEHKLPEALADIDTIITSPYMDNGGLRRTSPDALKLRASIYNQMGKTELAKRDIAAMKANYQETMDAVPFRTK